MQPFSVTELPCVNNDKPTEEMKETFMGGDVAMGFEKGVIRVFDISYLFKDTKLMEEKRHSFFVSQFVLNSRGK